MKKYLVKTNFGCRDAYCGSLEVWTEEELELVNSWVGMEVYFGEIAGKHSEVYGTLEAGDFEVLKASECFIEEFKKLFSDDMTRYNSETREYEPVYNVILNYLKTDYFGNPRICNGTIDIGAMEYCPKK